jgi:hypothetical protein
MLVKQKSLRNRMLYTKHPAREGLVYTLEKTAGQGNGRLVSFELISIAEALGIFRENPEHILESDVSAPADIVLCSQQGNRNHWLSINPR